MAQDEPDMPDTASDMDDDEALRYAIALSLQDQSQSQSQTAPDRPTQASQPLTSQVQFGAPSQATFGSLALDRKKMEEERLQRLTNNKRRRRSSSGAAAAAANTASDDEVVEVEPPPKSKMPFATSASDSTPSLPFPKGVVKRTWVRGYPRTSDNITIDEILQKDQLELAVISSFQWDEEWMLSKVNVSKSKLLLVAFAADNGQKEAMRANVPSSIRFCFPPMNGPGAMHSKLQLLKFPNYLRIVVPTGNLVPHDWGETGVMENMVFLIDLPRLSNSEEHSPTPFSTELGRFLEAAGVDAKMLGSLRNYDFAKTADLGFVYSIPGGHTDEAQVRMGYCGLGATVAQLGLQSAGPVDVDMACASLGSLNKGLIGAIYHACQGDDGLKEYHERTCRKPANKTPGVSDELKQRFRIYFPKERTVVESRGGRGAGGTICVQAKWWRSPTFPRDLIRDCVNNRDGLLMHTKVIFVRRRPAAGHDPASESPGWAYVGSANLSESAWGRLVKDKATGKPKMTCRNWECGVVIPVTTTTNSEESDLLTIFDGTVPVPMRVPGPHYGPTDEPWFFMGS